MGRLGTYGRAVLLLGVGYIGGWLLPLTSPLSSEAITNLRGAVVRESSIKYRYISPLLACDVGSENAFPEFAPLKALLIKEVEKQKRSGNVESASLYLRSLRTGRWLEVNGAESYAPASLLKIFVMMAYYKEANETDNPGLLERRVPFVASRYALDGDDVVGGSIKHLTDGELYTIDELINQMIVYSDNDAYATLLQNFDEHTLQALQAISVDLSVPLPINHQEEALDFMTVDRYSMVFRVLFGATYLSERYSEKALKLLSQATYTTGLVAGVPRDLVVAHKYGIRAVLVPSIDTPNELHDCGIIYYPDHPYLLCVMTKGNDLVAEQSAITALSSVAYHWLDGFYKKQPAL